MFEANNQNCAPLVKVKFNGSQSDYTLMNAAYLPACCALPVATDHIAIRTYVCTFHGWVISGNQKSFWAVHLKTRTWLRLWAISGEVSDNGSDKGGRCFIRILRCIQLGTPHSIHIHIHICTCMCILVFFCIYTCVFMCKMFCGDASVLHRTPTDKPGWKVVWKGARLRMP